MLFSYSANRELEISERRVHAFITDTGLSRAFRPAENHAAFTAMLIIRQEICNSKYFTRIVARYAALQKQLSR